MLTKCEIFLCQSGEDEVRDYIPLKEIAHIGIKQEVENDSTETLRSPLSYDLMGEHKKTGIKLLKAMTLNSYRFFNGFQLQTISDGYNNGRIYHMQASTKEECNTIVSLLTKYTKKATTEAKNANRFQMSQMVALAIYNSVPFQTLSALLILVVRSFFLSMSISRS